MLALDQHSEWSALNPEQQTLSLKQQTHSLPNRSDMYMSTDSSATTQGFLGLKFMNAPPK